MATDFSSAIAPLLNFNWQLAGTIGGLLFLAGLGVWWVTRRGKVKWHIQLYERDSSGVPIPIGTDILREKVINKGKNTVYVLQKYQGIAHPPVSKFIYKRTKTIFGKELWCDYLRERQDFIPVRRLVELGVNNTEDMAEFTRKLVEIYKTKPEEASQKYIYSPIVPKVMAKLNFEPMEYHKSEMMQMRLQQRELLYNDRQNFMQTYGPAIGIGLAAVCIIVVGMLGFQFATDAIQTSTAAANKVAIELGGVAASVQNANLG